MWLVAAASLLFAVLFELMHRHLVRRPRNGEGSEHGALAIRRGDPKSSVQEVSVNCGGGGGAEVGSWRC